MLEGTGARDEIWHGDTGARMARRARDLSDSLDSLLLHESLRYFDRHANLDTQTSGKRISS